MAIRSLIDDRKKAKFRDAMKRGDNSIFGKKKAEIEPMRSKSSKKLAPELEAGVDSQLLRAIFDHNPNAVKEAIEKGAYVDLQTGIPGCGTGSVLALATQEFSNEYRRPIDSLRPGAMDDLTATLHTCKEIVKLLIINGADPNVHLQGKTILEYYKYSFVTGRCDEIIDLLKQHGAK